MLEVQRRLKELDEREARLAEKEKESAVCVASAAAKAFKSVPVTAKYQSTPAESSFPTIDASSIMSLLPTQTASSFSSGSSAAAIMTLLYEQQTDERVNRLRDENE